MTICNHIVLVLALLNTLYVQIESVEVLDVCSTKLFIWDLFKHPEECTDIPSTKHPDVFRIWYTLGAYYSRYTTIPVATKTGLTYDFQAWALTSAFTDMCTQGYLGISEIQ